MTNGGTASREALPTWLPSFSGGLPLTPAPESSLDPSGLFSPGLQPKVSRVTATGLRGIRGRRGGLSLPL